MTWRAIYPRPYGQGTITLDHMLADERIQNSHGRAVHVDPIKPTLKAPGTMHSKLKCDGTLSKFAFNFNLRLYITGPSRPQSTTTRARPRRRRQGHFIFAVYLSQFVPESTGIHPFTML